MTPSDWIAILGIVVTALTVLIGGMSAFLFRQALKTNTLETKFDGLEYKVDSSVRKIDRFEEGMSELRDYLFAHGVQPRKKKSAREMPDSDEATA